MEQQYKPVDCGFHDHLEAAATKHRYVQLHYYTEIHELKSVMAVVKDIFTKDKEEFLLLSTGDEIRLDRIVKIDDEISPEHSGFDDFSCEC